MTLVELTHEDGFKVIINFNYVILVELGNLGTLIQTNLQVFEVKESPQEIEDLLSQVRVYVKRAYKPQFPINGE